MREKNFEPSNQLLLFFLARAVNKQNQFTFMCFCSAVFTTAHCGLSPLAAEGKKMKGIVVKWNNFRSIEIYSAVNLIEGEEGKRKGRGRESFRGFHRLISKQFEYGRELRWDGDIGYSSVASLCEFVQIEFELKWGRIVEILKLEISLYVKLLCETLCGCPGAFSKLLFEKLFPFPFKSLFLCVR